MPASNINYRLKKNRKICLAKKPAKQLIKSIGHLAKYKLKPQGDNTPEHHNALNINY